MSMQRYGFGLLIVIGLCVPSGVMASPLHEAAFTGDQAMADLLIDHGANVNAMDRYHRTPLYLAVAHGHAFIARLLMTQNAKVNIRAENGLSPLAVAIQKGHHGD